MIEAVNSHRSFGPPPTIHDGVVDSLFHRFVVRMKAHEGEVVESLLYDIVFNVSKQFLTRGGGELTVDFDLLSRSQLVL
jgi:hypothetical protein